MGTLRDVCIERVRETVITHLKELCHDILSHCLRRRRLPVNKRKL